MDCAHLPAIHPHSKLWGILAFSRELERHRAARAGRAQVDWEGGVDCEYGLERQ
ncbi:MAG: hypothetical protein PVH50_08135 [Anaerolineae bacterium]